MDDGLCVVLFSFLLVFANGFFRLYISTADGVIISGDVGSSSA